MPLQATSGAASQDAFGGNGVAVVPTYIEEVFSTQLYTGNGSTGQTINNGIDLSTKGGLVWTKNRGAAVNHSLVDTVRVNSTYNPRLSSNSSAAEVLVTIGYDVTGYTTTGYTIGPPWDSSVNGNTQSYASWTFRKQPKFFDVVTYTGTGSNRTIAHSLGSVPACIIVKRTDTTANWAVYHRSLANTQYLVLNTTAAAATGATWWNSTTPTSAVFSLGTDASVNASGGTYVAYIYAHDAGGFGLAGTDNVISCGSYTEGASATTVTLGYEPQWLLVKKSSATSGWVLIDNMRGFDYSDTKYLEANTSAAEAAVGSSYFKPTPTGFIAETAFFGNGSTMVYIAIRRGPMKVPTTGTSVYFGSLANSSVSIPTGFVPDTAIARTFDSANPNYIGTRLQGSSVSLQTNDIYVEGSFGWGWSNKTNTFSQSSLGNPVINWVFGRASGFHDVVCYTGTGSAGLALNHNLTVVPELIILQRRTGTPVFSDWSVYSKYLNGGVTPQNYYLSLNLTDAQATASNIWNNTAPSSSTFTVGNATKVNASGSTYVAFLFATCAGVSKVFSYTGNGSSQTINCGFTAGSRWVMIKRTDAAGDWYVWDSTRGIVAGNDRHLSLNDTAAEVTTDDSVDTDNTGFVVNQLSATNVNVTSATYIGIAIA